MVLAAVWELTPSVTVKSKLAFKFSVPFCTKRTCPALIWFWVKVLDCTHWETPTGFWKPT